MLLRETDPSARMSTKHLREGLRWSAGDLRRLVTMAQRGERLTIIARRLERTRQAVQYQAEKRGFRLVDAERPR